MSLSHSVRRAVRYALFAGAMVAASPPAHAADSEETISEVVVTGTRIPRANLTAPTAVTTIDSAVIQQSGRGTRDVVGLLPLGPGATGRDEVSFFWNAQLSDVERIKARGFAAWRAQIEAFAPEARGILQHLHDFDQLSFSTHADVTMDRWHTARVVVMGDAAHAMNPQLGLGANMGLVDAAVLADCLDSVQPPAVAVALLDYQQRRQRQLRFYQRVSRALGSLHRLDSQYAGWPRALVLGASQHLPFMRQQVLKAVFGYSG
jgi:2-polyprenyl-6-methoxyphenol hydroxylase-like FAD-dependent oxidoreductase